HQRLKYERELRGWSQADVATRIRCDTKTVGRWERGIASPGPYLRQKLVKLFGKNAEELGLIEEDARSNSHGQVQLPEESNASELVRNISWKEDWGEAPHI